VILGGTSEGTGPGMNSEGAPCLGDGRVKGLGVRRNKDVQEVALVFWSILLLRMLICMVMVLVGANTNARRHDKNFTRTEVEA
jgi:hypothetical protein